MNLRVRFVGFMGFWFRLWVSGLVSGFGETVDRYGRDANNSLGLRGPSVSLFYGP